MQRSVHCKFMEFTFSCFTNRPSPLIEYRVISLWISERRPETFKGRDRERFGRFAQSYLDQKWMCAARLVWIQHRALLKVSNWNAISEQIVLVRTSWLVWFPYLIKVILLRYHGQSGQVCRFLCQLHSSDDFPQTVSWNSFITLRLVFFPAVS